MIQSLWARIVGLALAGGWLSSTGASLLQHPYVYRSPAALAIGGADVALAGDRATVLFANPAGLTAVPKGWSFTPLALSASATERTRAFARDLDRALGIDDTDRQRQALLTLVSDYRGENIHAEAANASGLTWRGTRGGRTVALGLVWLHSGRFDARTHQGFGEDGLVTVNAQILKGPVLGAAVELGGWRLGFDVKTLTRRRLFGEYSPFQLIEIARDDERDFGDEFSRGQALGLDAGTHYQSRIRWLGRPRLALAVHNVGGLDFGSAGALPQSLDLGLAVFPELPGLVSTRVSFEYTDALHAVDSDDDPLKRTRLGVRFQAPDVQRLTLAYSLGLYQGAPTAGVEVQYRGLRVTAASYAEEQGAYAGQDRERRYLLSFEFGWHWPDASH